MRAINLSRDADVQSLVNTRTGSVKDPYVAMVNQDTENHLHKIKYGSLTLDDLSTGFHVWKANSSAKTLTHSYILPLRKKWDLPGSYRYSLLPCLMNSLVLHIFPWPPAHMSGVTQTTLVLSGSCLKLTSGSGSINPMIADKYKLWK